MPVGKSELLKAKNVPDSRRAGVMVIRDAQLRDAHGIAEVHVRTWQAAYAGIVPGEDLAQLYGATETRIRRTLIENLVLWVFEKNARARSFYEAVGYRLEHGKQKEMRFVGATAMQVRYRKLLKAEG